MKTIQSGGNGKKKDDGCRDHPPSMHYDPPPPLLLMATLLSLKREGENRAIYRSNTIIFDIEYFSSVLDICGQSSGFGPGRRSRARYASTADLVVNQFLPPNLVPQSSSCLIRRAK